jgi:uncharacterized protein (DUF3084 family)
LDVVSGLVVVLLVLLSGAVAALGDWLGRRLGKKRLRIGKLRPKHTAIVTTFIAGMLITLVTIVILSLMSEQVRKWLVEGADVQRQLEETRGDLATAERQLEQGQRDIAGVRSELAGERQKLADEQKRVEEATREAAAMRAEAADLRAQVGTIGGQLKESSERLERLRAEYSTLEKNIGVLQGNIAEYNRQQEELFRQNNELLATNEKYLEDIAGLERRIESLNKSVSDAQEEQRVASQNFERERQRIEADRTKALNDLQQAESQLGAARRELSELQRAAFLLQTDTSRALFNRLIYNRGDELARLPVRSMLSQAEARTFLLAALEMASRDAISKGATESQSSDSAAVFPQLRDDDGNPITPEMLFQRAVEEIAGKDAEQIVVVRAFVNAFRGGYVAVAVEAVPNGVVYEEGDFIIETRLDGRKGVQGVTDDLGRFIATQLRERAVRDGMVPATGRATELGEVTQEQIQQVVTTIVESGRTVTVRFHAARQTRAGEPLVLDIRLR